MAYPNYGEEAGVPGIDENVDRTVKDSQKGDDGPHGVDGVVIRSPGTEFRLTEDGDLRHEGRERADDKQDRRGDQHSGGGCAEFGGGDDRGDDDDDDEGKPGAPLCRRNTSKMSRIFLFSR
nr:hypothetical protein BaRGS_029091 [Batillaria attramentaria]